MNGLRYLQPTESTLWHNQKPAARWSLVYRMFRRYTPEYEQHAFVHVNIAKHIATKPDHRTIFHNIS